MKMAALSVKSDVTKIDSGIENKWRWDWLERKAPDGSVFSLVFEKLNKKGIARCKLCCCELNYGRRGFVTLSGHVKSEKHRSRVEIQKTNYALPGCELVKAGLEAVTGFTGESVVLPCVCTDLQDKPKSVKWAFTIESGTNYQEIYPEQTGHHRNRVKLVSKIPSGNLSLLISDLTEEDQGDYSCSVQADHKYFRLSVKVRRGETSTRSSKTDTTPPSEPTILEQDKQQTHSSLPIVFGILAVLLLVIPGVVTFICWRRRGGRCGENRMTEERPDWKRKQKDQTGPDVTYSTVTHINTAGAARVQINAGEETEYASIITN
ncbi:uncharacterized protein LOC132881495 isoform X2 [Neoarius graeffei]|uniref:uncharacterized protein LOC132881495 isoform X2 n=1 Tax=Neoarius graeffei TaxID=443677 RepID=UPI00298C66E6|nr:uncharacterized protein LOC132881495 isoform X2 [Neoarius graeffei]